MSTPAQALYAESKLKISDRVQGSVKDVGTLAKQVVKGSKSGEILGQSIKQFAAQDYAIESTEINLKKMENVNNQIRFLLQSTRIDQLDSITNRVDICLNKLNA